MIITKTFEVGIDVYDPINLHTNDENIKAIIADKFEGRCFRGSWVRKVEKILKVGECVISQDGNPNFGTMPVIFEATVIEYARGEIINGCIVKNKDASGRMICSTDIASIMLSPHKLLESIVVGQLISIRVAGAKYNQGVNKVSINAIPYLFPDVPVVFKVPRDRKIPLELLAESFARVDAEEALLVELKKSKFQAWEAFDKLLYAYAVEQKIPKSDQRNIRDVVESGFEGIEQVSRDNKLNLSEPLVITSVPTNCTLIENAHAADIAIYLLEDYAGHLRTIREMIDIYSTQDLMKTHKNLWQIFKKSKLGAK
jgi:DNA-directed RNA polymerase subunit E'/Rpb7